MGRALRFLVVAAIALAPGSVSAQDEIVESEGTRVDARVRRIGDGIEALARGRGAEAAEDALAHARRALAAGSRADRETRPDESDRAFLIAEAALVLGERLAARARAHADVEEARRRMTEAEARARTARAALEHALEERARVGPPRGVDPAATDDTPSAPREAAPAAARAPAAATGETAAPEAPAPGEAE